MAEAQKQAPSLEDLRARREEILQLAAKYGASNVRVVGSVARGESGPESDVDFLVTVREGVSIFDLVGLWLDMKGLLGYEVSLISDETPDERFLSRIRQDAVAL
jgi:predicted nucleotidyltransferase